MTLTVETFKTYLNNYDLCACGEFIDTADRLRDQAGAAGNISEADQMDALLSEVQALPIPAIEPVSEDPVARVYEVVSKTLCLINGVQRVISTRDLPLDTQSIGSTAIEKCRSVLLTELGVNTSLQGDKWVVA